VTLVAEVLGVLLGGAAIAILARAWRRGSFSRTAGVAVVVTMLAAVLCVPNLWSALRGFATSAATNQRLSAPAAEIAAGTSANNAFLGWARAKMLMAGRQPEFWLAPAAARKNSFTHQWSTYRLLPARQADLMGQADWIVFYKVNPAQVDYDRAVFASPTVYGPGFALAQRKRDG
jgi:hypothetical protein